MWFSVVQHCGTGVEMAGEAWSMQTGMKGKPGAQGTLFQVGDKDSVLNPAQRWPRGYTPERQQDIREALENTTFTSSRVVPTNLHEQRARVTDALARSTVRPGLLRLLRGVDDRPEQGHDATYYPDQNRLAVQMTRYDPARSDSAAKDLLHEVGHHAVNATPTWGDRARHGVIAAGEQVARKFMPAHAPSDAPIGATARAMAYSHVSSGVHERAADDFMVEHYRTRGRNPQPVAEGRYEEKFGEAVTFQKPGYGDVRSRPHMGPQFEQGALF